MKSKIVNLVVVAHPDDEILGFGAAGAKLVSQGEVVQAIILCGNVDARTHRPTNQELYDDMVNANKAVGFEVPELGQFPNIKMNTVPHLEVVQFIEKMIENRDAVVKSVFKNKNENGVNLPVAFQNTIANIQGQLQLNSNTSSLHLYQSMAPYDYYYLMGFRF